MGQHCGNCDNWTFDGECMGGKVGECTCEDVLKNYPDFFPWTDGFTVRSVGRYANDGQTCEYWRAKSGN